MAMRTEMMSIAMPQPAKVKGGPVLTSCPSPGKDRAHRDAPPRWIQTRSAREPETACQGPHKGRNEEGEVGGLKVTGRKVTGRAKAGGEELDSPCRAGMAFHTDTGPWLAN